MGLPDPGHRGRRPALHRLRPARSDRPAPGYDHDTFAEDLASLIDRLDVDEVTFVGRRTAALIPDSSLVVYHGSGHGLYAADHQRVNSDILAFVAAEQALAARV